MSDQLRNEFLMPPAVYRGAPFWSWNDQLDSEELARQVRDMQAHGMGGFFMHSREGLETAYMGPEWLECIRETVKVAKAEGMGAWLYDEDRWPSGAAGGLVPARGGDAFRAKVVTLEEYAGPTQDTTDALAIFAATLQAGRIVSLRRISNQPAEGLANHQTLSSGETWLVLRREISGASEWFNDDAYADNLNPDAVAAFIDITYEAYRRQVGQEFGGTVPGIFTDEPNAFAVKVRSGRRALPWTDGLPEYFYQRRGYDLLNVLPWLFYEGEGAARRGTTIGAPLASGSPKLTHGNWVSGANVTGWLLLATICTSKKWATAFCAAAPSCLTTAINKCPALTCSPSKTASFSPSSSARALPANLDANG